MRQPLRVPLGKQCRQAALGCQMLESARGSGCCVLVVCGVWCVVCGVWCVVCGVWCPTASCTAVCGRPSAEQAHLCEG